MDTLLPPTTGLIVDNWRGRYGVVNQIRFAAGYGFNCIDLADALYPEYEHILDVSLDATNFLNDKVAEVGKVFDWLDGDYYYMPIEFFNDFPVKGE